MSGGEEPAVAVCFDQTFVPHAATALYSLARSQDRCGPVFLVSDKVDTADLERLLTFAGQCGLDAKPVEVPEHLVKGFVDADLPRVTWFRTVLPDVLPDCDRVIYLDCDLIVLHDLAALWHTPLKDEDVFGAVAHPSYWGVESHVARLQLPRGSQLFNAGVLLMDLERMRSVGFSSTIRTLAGSPKAATFVYADQDTMNVAFAGQWTQLDPKWNCLTSIAMPFLCDSKWADDAAYGPVVLERAARSPAIVHFEGWPVVRPWHVRCFHPFRSVYREYRAATPWPLTELQRRSARDTVLAHFPPRLQAKIWSVKHRLTPGRHRTA